MRDIRANRTEKFIIPNSNPQALQIARDPLRVGGYFICNNMLRAGRVLTDDAAPTRGVLELTRLLMQARDFVTTILPVRDGVSLSLRVQ